MGFHLLEIAELPDVWKCNIPMPTQAAVAAPHRMPSTAVSEPYSSMCTVSIATGLSSIVSSLHASLNLW